MSRYDGLIIPRSYSEYINKTDAATLQQALQLSGVLSGAVAAGDNKAVTSNAVNVALADYERIRKYTIYFSPILNNDDSVSSFKEWVLSNISSWNDGDLIKLTSSNNRNAYFHLMKQSNTNFNLFYYTYYQQYPIVYRYVDTSWRIVTPTSTSAAW